MKHLLILTALTLLTAGTAQANRIIQPYCGEGSACQAAMEITANPNYAALSANDAGPSWELGPVSPIADSVAVCTATEGCDPVLRTPVVVGNDCSLSEPESFLGHHISILADYPDLWVRVFDPDHLVGTTDNRPGRFNLTTDADGVIVTSGCG